MRLTKCAELKTIGLLSKNTQLKGLIRYNCRLSLFSI